MADLAKLIDSLSELTVMEAADLVTQLEEKWGVKAASGGAPVMMVAGGADAPAVEEQTEFDLVLKSVGAKKINVIKAVREITGAGLKEAKALVDDAPSTLKEAISKDEAEGYKEKLTDAGAEVELK